MAIGILSVMTHAAFLEQLGSKFKLHIAPNIAKEAELIEVNSLASVTGQIRNPFSLVFRTPYNLSLSQDIYKLEHTSLGELHIFLVPIGPDSQGMRLEAVFN
jgi:hypothetical protein